MAEKKSLKPSSVASGSKLMIYSRYVAVCLLLLGAIFLLVNTAIISLSWLYSLEEIIAWKHESTPLFHKIMADFDIPLSYERYQLARPVSLFLTLLLLTFTFLFFRYRHKWMTPVQRLSKFALLQLQYNGHAFQRLSFYEKGGLIAILLLSVIYRIYLFFYLPPQVDELETYYSFVEECFLLTNVFYPYPNNHVFFNYFYLLSSQLFDPLLLAARLPSFIFYHLLLVLIFFGILRYYKSTTAAFASVLLCMFLFPSSVYAMQGRGYILFSWLMLLAVFSLLLALEYRKWQNEALTIFVLSSALGAFTIPVFLLPFISMLLFAGGKILLRRDWLMLKKGIVSVLVVGLLVSFCYLPIFLFSGIGAITANEFVLPSQVHNFHTDVAPLVVAEMLSYLASTPTRGWVVWLMFGLLGLRVCIKAEKRITNWLVLAALTGSTIILHGLAAQKFMYERTATYAVYLLYPAIALILVYHVEELLPRKIKKAVYTMAIAALPVLSYFQYQHNTYEWSLVPNRPHEILSKYSLAAVEHNWAVFFEGKYWCIEFGYFLYLYQCEIKGVQPNLADVATEADLMMADHSKFFPDMLEREGLLPIPET
jgi:hypothetical protein